MKANIYSVKDELTGKYHNPIFIPTSERADEEITRIFKSQLNNTQLWKDNPEDFSLYLLGEMDDGTGTFENNFKKICDGRSVKNG